MRLACEHLVSGLSDEPVGPGVITIEDELVTGSSPGLTRADQSIDGWVVPGFVDTHCHGAAGVVFTDPDADAVRAAVDHHRRHGSTTLFASTVTEELPVLMDQIGTLRRHIVEDGFAGIHLEGPFLAAARTGAQNPELLLRPDRGLLAGIVAACGPDLRMVTLAPEVPGGLASVRMLATRGIVAAFGHSDADEIQVREGIDAGMSVATHLFNAMRPIHHRQPGPIPVLLTDPRVAVELICDGIHVHADVIAMVVAAAGPDRVMIVTDAIGATGQPDGDYTLGSMPVIVVEGVARLATPDGRPGAIAGSTLTMDRAVQHLVATLGMDIPTVSLMASTTPATRHRLAGVGRLAPGYRADLCVLADDGSLRGVMRRGTWLVRP